MSRLQRNLYNFYLLMLLILFVAVRILPSNTLHFVLIPK